MSTVVVQSSAGTPVPGKEHGFSVSQGANWSNYLAYRPIYPYSFFERIYAYHSQKPNAAWSVAHDIGAGCGIVSSTLASRFNHVVVSDPNDGYVALARKLLVKESFLPESKFTFLQEGAENSSVGNGTVDLAAVCECIHWTDTDMAIKEFGRQLRAGGTLVITHYTVPRIVGIEQAQWTWKAIWDVYSQKAQGPLLDHAFPIINTGFESLGFPEGEWEAVERVYINSGGSIETFTMNDRVGECMVKEGEKRVWVEGDQDWWDEQGIDWFKGYLATWVPRVPGSEIQHVWDELETALKGQKVRIETPLVMVFATKRA